MRVRLTKNSVTITDANQNNLDIPHASVISINGTLTAGRAITGLKAGRAGDHLILINKTGQTLSFTDASASSDAGNRILNPGTLTIANNRAGEFLYDGDQDRWLFLFN